MLELKNTIENYLEYCRYQKKLSPKSLKAYTIDLAQFAEFSKYTTDCFHKNHLSSYIVSLHKQYKAKTIKRKIASLKAFCGYLEYEDLLAGNPFHKMKTRFQEPQILPRTIPFAVIRKILRAAYQEMERPKQSSFQRASRLRDTAVLEMLFATGLRVSELCSLALSDINLSDGSIRILGKGAKERLIQIGNQEVLALLRRYNTAFKGRRGDCPYFFINKYNTRLSEQSVRFMIRRYAKTAKVSMHITPHMFRHSFATLLLEEDVDIRYIQQMLGHSSIVTTQIYTHVAAKKQKKILTAKHPRNKMVMSGEIESGYNNKKA